MPSFCYLINSLSSFLFYCGILNLFFFASWESFPLSFLLQSAVLVFYCCPKKLPYTWWHKATWIYLAVLKVCSLKWFSVSKKSRCWHSCVSSWRFLGRIHFLAFSSFGKPSVFLGSWLPSSIFKGSNCGQAFVIWYDGLLFCLPLQS